MKQIPVKTFKNGFSLPVFGLGTWTMGGTMERDLKNDDARDIAVIKKAIEAGIRLIDTAELYAAGHADELIAEGIKDYKREELFIVSKVFKTHLKYDAVIESLNKSLDRLKTTYVDLFLVHAPNPEIPLRETMKAMDYLMAAGLTKYLGVSNFNVEQLKEAQSYSKNKIVCNQILYNLKVRDFNEHSGEKIVEYCQKHDIAVMCYRPIERGVLTTKENPLMAKMCEKYKKTPAQIAINWLISQPNLTTISKISNENHLKENLGALGWKMDKRDIDKLRDVSSKTKCTTSSKIG